jgi:hypothetical protein
VLAIINKVAYEKHTVQTFHISFHARSEKLLITKV